MKQGPQKKASASKSPSPPKRKKASQPARDFNHHQRSFGGPLHFLEEREWRFVVRQTGKRVIPKGAKQNSGSENSSEPPWYMPYTPGKDLFTVVFPDNQTLAMAMACTCIRSQLFPLDRPHVTVLSLEDVGTF